MSYNKIRLLVVYNSNNKDRFIKYRLVSAYLTKDNLGALYNRELVEFKTLLYIQGDLTATRVAIIDRYKFLVMQNLNAILRSI